MMPGTPAFELLGSSSPPCAAAAHAPQHEQHVAVAAVAAFQRQQQQQQLGMLCAPGGPARPAQREAIASDGGTPADAAVLECLQQCQLQQAVRVLQGSANVSDTTVRKVLTACANAGLPELAASAFSLADARIGLEVDDFNAMLHACAHGALRPGMRSCSAASGCRSADANTALRILPWVVC